MAEIGYLVPRYQQLVGSGRLSPEDGKHEARAALRAMRFGGDGRVVVIDPAKPPGANPSKPETEGKFLGDYSSAKGTYAYRQITAIAKSWFFSSIALNPRPRRFSPSTRRPSYAMAGGDRSCKSQCPSFLRTRFAVRSIYARSRYQQA
jgi:hypothetical protein